MEWDPVRAESLAFLKACEKLRQGGWSSGKVGKKGEALHRVISSHPLLDCVWRNQGSGYKVTCGCWNSHEFWEPTVWRSKLDQIQAWKSKNATDLQVRLQVITQNLFAPRLAGPHLLPICNCSSSGGAGSLGVENQYAISGGQVSSMPPNSST